MDDLTDWLVNGDSCDEMLSDNPYLYNEVLLQQGGQEFVQRFSQSELDEIYRQAIYDPLRDEYYLEVFY